MAKRTNKEYGNESISSLKGADRVRKRPGVIFGSDGLEGCEHAVFEILSNSIDEAREGYGREIILTSYRDRSIEVEDFGRGCPVDYNPAEKRYNWELVFCELYAGGKYDNEGGDNYEYSLGLNGLGSCATQYSSEYMDVTVWRDGKKYDLHFEKGENVGGLRSEPYAKKRTGSRIRWKPDLEVFTDIAIPAEYFEDVMKKQAVVNSGVLFRLRIEEEKGFRETEYVYENGIRDYVAELAGEDSLTLPEYIEAERRGRDREDMP
ncbi:MAG: DNA topoisomerase, partial [Oscillospiraceae bacterium]|nr:DNA topoisomerase [Oscillospiraceae bacterium]